VKKIVVLGMLSKMPVAGIAYLTMAYVVGLERLGYEAYYVEAHATWPHRFMSGSDDGSSGAARYIDETMRWFGMPPGRWAYHGLHDARRGVVGMRDRELRKLYRDAEVVINLHGGTIPLPSWCRGDRLVLIDTDPVEIQVLASNGDPAALDFLDAHAALFTWGEKIGREDCGVPVPAGYQFRPTRVPVLLDFWATDAPPGDALTTVGNWAQDHADAQWAGQRYTWSKHHEWLKILELPQKTGAAFELALASYDGDTEAILRSNGWAVRPADAISADPATYRDYIQRSRGEFTVAKDQNIRLSSGWFSDRGATYLAAGRPVIAQATGFSDQLPTGEGLFSFETFDDAVAAVEAVSADPLRHGRAAREIAGEYFDAPDRVLARLLDDLGLQVPSTRARQLPGVVSLVPRSRRPLVLEPATRSALASLDPRAGAPAREPLAREGVSVVVVSHNTLDLTKLCLYSLLGNTGHPELEVVVVDNGSTDGSGEYLSTLATRRGELHVIRNDSNRGFATAVNQGVTEASGGILILLNSDCIVPPGWLGGLSPHLQDPRLGAVGPVTNRIGNEAQVETDYATYRGFLEEAGRRGQLNGRAFEAATLTMFCFAFRKHVFDEIGPLDERFEVGLLEDDDYCRRLRAAGYRLLIAEDVLVHHFGEASFGNLFASGGYSAILESNKRLYEEKWGEQWEPYEHRIGPRYRELRQRIERAARQVLEENSLVAVVSRGDDELLRAAGARATHFPATVDGSWAGHHPADGREVISSLASARAQGIEALLVPSTAFWWLDFYDGLRGYLDRNATVALVDESCLIFRFGAGRGEELVTGQLVGVPA
jgi:GT2 family glycosyltransferase